MSMNKVRNILLVSNMYPTKKHPVFGVFVKNTEILLNSLNLITKKKSVIYGRNSGLKKIISYAKLYLKTFFYSFDKSIDIVLAHFPLQVSPVLLFLSYVINKKIVLNIHGSELNKSSIFSTYFTKLLGRSDLIIVPSNYYKSRLIEEYSAVANKIYVFPSGGVNFSVFKPLEKQPLREKYNLLPNGIYCSYISTIIEQKGWKVFFDASLIICEKDSEILFLVVGNGPDEKEFKEKVISNNLSHRYKFFDRQAQLDLVNFYNCSDVFIFPTYRKEESLGLVGLEALACGIPVIGSKIGAITDYVIDKENGYLFKPKDAEDLAVQILNFKIDRNRIDFKNNALENIKEYEDTIVANELAIKVKSLFNAN